MNYIDLINHFWRTDEGAQFTGWEAKLYFYLIKTANSLGWVNVFWHSDSRVSANVGMSVNTMKTSRNRLKQAGLIDFVSGGKGHGDKTRYQILLPKVFVKEENEELKEMTRYQNLRTKPAPEPGSETGEAPHLTSGHQELVPKLPPKLIPKLTPKPAPLTKQNETKLNVKRLILLFLRPMVSCLKKQRLRIIHQGLCRHSASMPQAMPMNLLPKTN
jgi:hypothetical protein